MNSTAGLLYFVSRNEFAGLFAELPAPFGRL